MASRYWVGGSSTWDATAGTKWALTSGGAGGQAVPTSADDVFLDAASGAVTVTVSGTTRPCKTLICTGFTGTLAGSIAITASGNVTLVVGMTVTWTGTLTIQATATLTTAGKTLGSVISAGTSITLGSALTCTGAFTVSTGSFTTSASNYAITALSFIANVSVTRTITLNASVITLSSTGTAVNIDSTFLTFNRGTSTFNLTGAGPNLIVAGAVSFYNVTFSSTTAGLCSIRGANTFNTLTLTPPAATGITRIAIDGNQTVTTLVCAGASAVRRLFVYGDLLTDAQSAVSTLTVGTYTTKTDVDFKYITAAGTSAPWSGTRLGDAGGNTSITFGAAKTVYWNLTGTTNWSSTGWATTSGGAPAVNNFPLAQDTAVFNNTGAAGTITVDASWNVGTVDMSARTSAMTLSTLQHNVYGNWINGSGLTISNGGTLNFYGESAQTITSAGKTFTGSININGTSVTLQDVLTVSTDTFLNKGTLDLNSYNVSSTTFNSDPGNPSVVTFTRALAFGTGTWTITGSGTGAGSSPWTTISSQGGGGSLTASGAGTISFTAAGSKEFSNGATSFATVTLNQGGAGALRTSSTESFADITNTYSATGATTITFGGTTTVTDFTATGTVGKVLTLNSTTNGTARTLTKTGGVVSVDYMSIRDSAATGGARWYAGANSTNVSNNTGWIFTVPATPNFFFLF